MEENHAVLTIFLSKAIPVPAKLAGSFHDNSMEPASSRGSRAYLTTVPPSQSARVNAVSFISSNKTYLLGQP